MSDIVNDIILDSILFGQYIQNPENLRKSFDEWKAKNYRPTNPATPGFKGNDND